MSSVSGSGDVGRVGIPDAEDTTVAPAVAAETTDATVSRDGGAGSRPILGADGFRLRDRKLRALAPKVGADGRIDLADAERLIEAAEDGPGLSGTETRDLNRLLERVGESIDPDAKQRLLGYLGESGTKVDVSMRDRGLRRLLPKLGADGKISEGDADKLIERAEDGRGLSKTERKDLQRLLDDGGDKIEASARDKIETYLAGGAAAAATDAMSRTLLDAVKDGVLGAAELQAAEADIAARYGPEVAATVLLESFGVHAEKLDFNAVDFLQGRIGSISETHIPRYTELLDGNLVGAKILDINRDGQLDADDLVFSPGASGQVNVERVGAARTDELKISKAMVDACQAMDDAGHSFELIKNHRANEDFFEVGPEGTFILKDGQNAADAVRDIFENPSEYGFECATAMVIVYYKSMLELVGDKDFNRVAGDLRIGPWDYEGDLSASFDVQGSSSTERPGDAATPRPGEYGYIKNWDVSDEGKAAGWQGENVLYMGDGIYYGHPFGAASAETIVSYLNTHRNEGSDRSASFLSMKAFLTRHVMTMDENPG